MKTRWKQCSPHCLDYLLSNLGLFQNLLINQVFRWEILQAGTHFSQNLLDREIDQLLELLEILERKRVCTSVEDRRDWVVDSSGEISCKYAFT